MQKAEVRDGHVYVVDTVTGKEVHIYVPEGAVRAAEVTGDDEVTVSTDHNGGMGVRYRISTGFRV